MSMKATIKIEFNEQSKGVTAQAKVELEGNCNSDEDLESLRIKAQEESVKAFESAFALSQRYSMRK